jgi:hypothetical protein
MPSINPGPASTTTPNTQASLEALAPTVATIIPTFAQLPAAFTVPSNTTVYTNDYGFVVSDGTAWHSLGFQGTSAPAGIIAQSGLPLIIVPSGSAVSAVGAITLGTTLPIAAGSCFGYLPANYLGTQQPTAGWYYGTITDSTHILMYQNTWSGTGVAAIPTTLVPWAGLSGGTPTGSTGAQTVTFTVPANVLGPNGALEVGYLASYNSSGSLKTVSMAFGTLAGPSTANATTTSSLGVQCRITNSGRTDIQVCSLTPNVGYATAAQVLGYGAVDTTLAQNLVITINNAAATDFLILNSYSIKVYPAA